MKKFLAFVLKESYHILRDKRTLMILFGMPVIQVLLFGYAITNELNRVKIAVLDKSKDKLSQQLINELTCSGYFSIEKYLVSENEIENEFKKGKIKEAIVIEPDFSQKLDGENKAAIQILFDASDPNSASILYAYTSNIIMNFSKHIEIEKNGKINSISEAIGIETKMLYNPELKSVYMFVPGITAVVLMLVSALMTALSIAREKELGTLEILLVSPLKPAQIIIGKVVPYIALGFFNACVIFALARFVFLVPISGSLPLLLSETLLYIICALSLGIMISSITKTQQVAMMIALVALMMPTMLLSGYIFAVTNMPERLQIITNIIPAKWYLIIVRNIMLKGTTFEYIYRETIILIIMTCIFIAVSVKKFNIRLHA